MRRNSSFDPGCGCCCTNAGLYTPDPHYALDRLVYEDELWSLQSVSPPYGVPGWCIVHTQRHVAGTADLDDHEAAMLGPFLRHVERALREVSGAVRVYSAVLSESRPHFRANLVPRHARVPADEAGWDLFMLHRRASAGEVEVDLREHYRIIEELHLALADNPPPKAASAE